MPAPVSKTRGRFPRGFQGGGRRNAPVSVLCLAALLGGKLALRADLSAPPDAEPNSPEEKSPGLAEPGLLKRAVPTPAPPPPAPAMDFLRFRDVTRPYDNTLALGSFPAAPYLPPDPSTFRPVVIYEPPLGLRPQVFRQGPVEFYPWAGLAQGFDSNVQLTQHHQISDVYTTPRFGLEAQLGTPDSIYNEYYDTVLAAQVSYEGFADLFYEHPGLSAYNHRFDFSGRVGRDRLKVRPFFNYSDVTGSNLQLAELQNRVQRLIALGGVTAEYDVTRAINWRQTYSGLDFQHGDPAYINYDTWSTRQELSWLMPNDRVRAGVWGGAHATSPDRGFSGNEYLGGIGWQGQFSTQWESELWVGWGGVDMNGTVPGRDNLSGLRFNGHTVLDLTSRVRLTLLYDRDYAFNELAKNDNYVATVTQLKADFFLADHWFVSPYLGTSVDQYETSRQLSLQIRPEIEFSYVFGREDFKTISPDDTLAGSRVFLKVGYDHTQNFRGASDVIEEVRTSVGFNWNF